MYEGSSYVVVYGSAPAYIQGAIHVSPRDIDVAFGGNVSEHDARQVVECWAEKNKLAGLSLDFHRYAASSKDQTVRLPVPIDAPLFFEVLQGTVNVERYEVHNLPALLRLSEWKGGKVVASRIMRRAQGEGHVGHPIIGLTALAWAKEMVDGYHGDGPEALANALRHADPRLFYGLGQFGELLLKIKELGADWLKMIRPEAEREAEKASAGGFGRYYFREFRGIWEAYLMYGKCYYEIPPISLPDFWKKVTGLDW